ncbi:hypothetical protein F4780DRAFT_761536 [Xylariomycetidae sp. FL0641]|nr:hypothetical protein F4780DRAFT_761536 [Xylariomycetidae sp. FL0641]
MSIPIPILWNLRVPLRRKFMISTLLSSAVFVISTAVVRAILTLIGQPDVITINLWGFRELGIGLISVTAPVIYPIFTPEFWRKGPYVPKDRRRMMEFTPRRPSKTAARYEDLELREIDEGATAVRYIDDPDIEAAVGRKSRKVSLPSHDEGFKPPLERPRSHSDGEVSGCTYVEDNESANGLTEIDLEG